MACKDQSISFLKSFGYNVIRLPKADISPLQMFVINNGILQPLGELTSVLIGNADAIVPSLKRDTPVANLSGKKTSDLSTGIGINILGNIIGAMGGSKLGLEAGYENSRTLVFNYGEVLEDTVQITELDKYLSNSDVNPSSRHVAELLHADEIFVISAVIKTNTITVEGKKKNDIEVKVNVPVIKEVIGANVEVKSNNENDSSITYKGSIPLGFGFQAVRLVYEDGQYQRFDPVADGSVSVAISPTISGAGTLFVSESTFTDITN